MHAAHAVVSGMGGIRTAGDLVARMQLNRGMRIDAAKKYVADKLGVSVGDLGDTIEMTYYLTDSQGAHENLTTQIKHITKNEKGRFQGHYMVGLSIM